MGQKLVIGPIDKGQRTDRIAFNIDNDSFPQLTNAYQWRGRIKRKRGTKFLSRLMRYFTVTTASNSLLSGLEAFSTLVPGTINIIDSLGILWQDFEGITPTPGVLNRTPAGPTGTVDYASGLLTGPTPTNAGSFNYYPDLPVMGIEDLVLTASSSPGTLAFDTVYAYNVLTTSPSFTYDVSYYKNPGVDVTNLPGYIPKSTWTRTTWNGDNYQQFWTTNYQGALWATNGINVPFTGSTIGMQFAPASTITFIGRTATTITLLIINCPLVVGDFVFLNEFTAPGAADPIAAAQSLNFQSGYVTAIAGLPAALTVTITLPFANIVNAVYVPGIVQYLTNRSNVLEDCIRWYDGDPTNADPFNPILVQGNGWVNFMPPISQGSFSIADLPATQYYLVGCRMIFPFKDRLLFIGPVIQSSTGSPIYLPDTVIYSQNGTPFYTASFTGSPVAANTQFHAILIPLNQTGSPASYFADQTGFGGFVQVGIDEPINTMSTNEDVIIFGMTTNQVRMVYTSNDLLPFNFYIINSELGSSSTFSAINMDRGVLAKGSRGFTITSQVEAQRFDLDIPDNVFQIRIASNGNERICAQRDFQNEWVQFTYPVDDSDYFYPNQTLQYNYRDATWALFNECYTTYGTFRISSGLTWATVGARYGTWKKWTDAWNSGQSNTLQPLMIGGNQQGFLIIKGVGIDESDSLFIEAFSGNIITSPDHCLNEGDYIFISGALGSIGSQVNQKVFSISSPDRNTFSLNPSVNSTEYLGNGLIKRFYVPFIQTKQFPIAWDMARKTRIGVQQYLLTTTASAQITLLIFLSQNASSAYNASSSPFYAPDNDALIYSNVLYTCPESTNLGLTPANSNLQMPTAIQQNQIWHRISDSLIGDTIQLGFTISDVQMRELEPINDPVLITGATNANPCVLTCSGGYAPNTLIRIMGVFGMVELNYDPMLFNDWEVLASDATTVTINVNSTMFGVYTSPNTGTATPVALNNQIEEIELHTIILDVSPSSLLA